MPACDDFHFDFCLANNNKKSKKKKNNNKKKKNRENIMKSRQCLARTTIC